MSSNKRKKTTTTALSVKSPFQKAIEAAEERAKHAAEEDEEDDSDYDQDDQSAYDTDSSEPASEETVCPDCWEVLEGDREEHECKSNKNNLKKHLECSVRQLLEETTETGYDEKHIRWCLRKLSQRSNLLSKKE